MQFIVTSIRPKGRDKPKLSLFFILLFACICLSSLTAKASDESSVTAWTHSFPTSAPKSYVTETAGATIAVASVGSVDSAVADALALQLSRVQKADSPPIQVFRCIVSFADEVENIQVVKTCQQPGVSSVVVLRLVDGGPYRQYRALHGMFFSTQIDLLSEFYLQSGEALRPLILGTPAKRPTAAGSSSNLPDTIYVHPEYDSRALTVLGQQKRFRVLQGYGDRRFVLSEPDFYRTLGRNDLVEKYEFQRKGRIYARLGEALGYGLGAVGTMMTLERIGGTGRELYPVAGATFILIGGAVTLTVLRKIWSSPVVDRIQAGQLADSYNAQVKGALGIQ